MQNVAKNFRLLATSLSFSSLSLSGPRKQGCQGPRKSEIAHTTHKRRQTINKNEFKNGHTLWLKMWATIFFLACYKFLKQPSRINKTARLAALVAMIRPETENTRCFSQPLLRKLNGLFKKKKKERERERDGEERRERDLTRPARAQKANNCFFSVRLSLMEKESEGRWVGGKEEKEERRSCSRGKT